MHFFFSEQIIHSRKTYTKKKKQKNSILTRGVMSNRDHNNRGQGINGNASTKDSGGDPSSKILRRPICIVMNFAKSPIWDGE